MVGRPTITLLVVGLALIMVAAPALIAVLAMMFGVLPGTAMATPILPVPFVPILELTRLLVTPILAATLIRTAESEA
jgi:Mg2+/Co2+ transporter CorB